MIIIKAQSDTSQIHISYLVRFFQKNQALVAELKVMNAFELMYIAKWLI